MMNDQACRRRGGSSLTAVAYGGSTRSVQVPPSRGGYHQRHKETSSSVLRQGVTPKIIKQARLSTGDTYRGVQYVALSLLLVYLVASWLFQDSDIPSDFKAKPLVVGFSLSPIDDSASTQRLCMTRIHPQSFKILQQQDSVVYLSTDSPQTPVSIPKSFPPLEFDFFGLRNRQMEELGQGWDVFKKIESDSEDYWDTKPYVLGSHDNDCILPHPWQSKAYPTCNNLHDKSLMAEAISKSHQTSDNDFFLSAGSFRQVFKMDDTTANTQNHHFVLKTMRMDKSFDEDALDRHRRDALIAQQLTTSPHILNVYGSCGSSAVYEFGQQSLEQTIGARENVAWLTPDMMAQQTKWLSWDSHRKLELSLQMVSAVVDLHGIDQDNRPSVVHGDLDISQFVTTDNGKSYKLNDFNGAHMMYWNPQEQQPCKFPAIMKGGKTRSPEEYAGKEVNEKIDIYGLGSVLYTIVTGRFPFVQNMDMDRVQELVLKGVRPSFHSVKEEAEQDPIVQALVDTIKWCWEPEPDDRPSAQQVLETLQPLVTELHHGS